MNIFGWSYPPGVSSKDIDDLVAEEETEDRGLTEKQLEYFLEQQRGRKSTFMGYNQRDDQFEYGYAPDRDGSDYNPNYQMADDWRDIYQDLRQNNIDEFNVVVVGRLYTGRSTISGATFPTDLSSLQGEIRSFGASQINNEVLAQRLLGMSQIPQHITGIYIMPLR